MEGHIYIYGEITSYQGADAVVYGAVNPRDVLNQIQANQEATDLVVHINSPGGDVDAGFAIFDILKTSGKTITTRIEGQCYSIATVIALSGSVRQATENSEFLIHNPYSVAIGDADDMEKRAVEIRKAENKIAEHYSAIANIDVDTALSEMKKDTFMDLEQAKEYGFITEIVETVKAVAKFNIKTENMASKEEKTFFNKLNDFFNSKSEEEKKNIVVKAASGKNVEFMERTEGEISKGDKATIDGEVADGEIVMASGETYVFANGVLDNIIPSEEKEDAEKLKMDALIEKAVTNALEKMQPELEKRDTLINSLQEKLNEQEDIFNGLKSIVSDNVVDNKEVKKSTSDKEDKVEQNVLMMGISKN